MEPELRDGDRLVIDTARRVPGSGELFALWDGALRLHSTNLDWPAYSRAAGEVHIVGKVLWKIARV